MGKIFRKILNSIPKKVQRELGYSKLGSKIVEHYKMKDPSKKSIYTFKNGIKIYSDLFNPREYELFEDKREPKTKEAFLKQISEGNTVIDCGAKIGEYSLIAAKKVGNHGKVISIEPYLPATIMLKNNFELNNFTNFKILNVAVSDKSGTTKFYENPVRGTGFLDPKIIDKKLTKFSEVKVQTLDEIISNEKLDRVHMIKIDVEGFEYETLKGCKNSLQKGLVDNFIIEIHVHYLVPEKGLSENDIYEFLKEYGFKIKVTDEDKNKPALHILATK